MSAAKTNMLFGALWCGGGLAVTAATYANAAPGGQYVVAYGAIAVGAIQFLIGVGQYFTSGPSLSQTQFAGAGTTVGGGQPAAAAGRTSKTTGPKGSLELVPVGGVRATKIGIDRLMAEGCVLGRRRDCDIVVEDDTVSKQHARLRLNGDGKLTIEDLGSGNGTWLGKERISMAVVESGEFVRFGSIGFRVELSDIRTADAKAAGAASIAFRTRLGRSEHCWLLSGFDEHGSVVQFSLEARVDPQSGEETDTTWTIGRKPNLSDHVLFDSTVSSEHARIRYRPGRGLEISDLGSSNGTRVDGQPIQRNYVTLEGARNLEFGNVKMTLSRA